VVVLVAICCNGVMCGDGRRSRNLKTLLVTKKKKLKKNIPKAQETLLTSLVRFFLFSSFVGCPGLCPSPWQLRGGAGGRLLL
jgi:hypothetical protein